MPTFRTLSADEIATREPRHQAVIDLSEYLGFLDGLNPGDGGEVKLQEGESRRVIKRRLTMSAKRQNKNIRWRSSYSSHNGVLLFEVR